MTVGADREQSQAPAGLPYHRIHEAGRPGVWRPLVGFVVMFLGFFAIGGLVATAVFAVIYGVTGQGMVDVTRLADLDHPTPAGLAFLNVALATFIPLAMFGERYLHGISPRWLASVRPRIRWRYLVACLGISIVALIATVIVSSIVPSSDADISSHANDFTATTFHYLLVIVLLTPFQAAGEEYLFRGTSPRPSAASSRGSGSRSSCPRSCSGSPTAWARASRSSSTGSRSASSPASSW